MLSFYNNILVDKNINNPEIIENIIRSVNIFTKFDEAVDVYVKNKELLMNFLTGHIKHLSSESLSGVVFQNIFELMKPGCTAINKSQENRLLIKNSYKNCFESNKDFYYLFLDAYVNVLNKDMTNYTVHLEELVKQSQKILNYSSQHHLIEGYFKFWEKSLIHFNDVMMIYEILIFSSPEITDTDSLDFSRFVFFLNTSSSRIFGKPYIQQACEFSEKYKSKSYSFLFKSFIYIFSELNDKIGDLKDNAKEKAILNSISKHDINFKELLDIVIDGIKEEKLANELETNKKKFLSLMQKLIETSDEHKKNHTVSLIINSYLLNRK